MVVCMAGPRSKTLRQKFKISADPGKHLTFLVFNLIWMDSFKLEGIISPDKFPHFVTAVKQADEALCGWRGASHANDKDTLQRRDLSPLEATKTKFLCVGLEEKYEARGFSLSQLKNNDKFIAQVLSCLNYLDVSLADVAIHRKEKLKVSHWTEALEKYVPCTELFHWTENGQNKLSSHPSFTDVNLSTALVGELKSVIEIDSRVPDASPLAKFYFQEIPTDLNRVGFKRCPVLVLRPKNPAEQEDQSLFYTTRDIVNKLPSALEDTYTGKGEIRRHLLTQITTVMNRIRRDDFEITSTTKPWFSQMDYCAKNWPAKTLFYVCHRLNAAEEGLFFLKMIAANKCFCSMHDTLNLTDDCIVKEFSILELVADFVKKFGKMTR